MAGEPMRDVLARMTDDAENVMVTLGEIGPLEHQDPAVLIEALGQACLVVRAAGMVAVGCGDALARIASTATTAAG